VARSGARGALGLDVADPVLSDQDRAFDVHLDGDGAHVVPGAQAPERLRLGIDRLTQVYLGAATARALHLGGHVEGSVRAAELLDQALAGPPLYLGLGNSF
jgi:hypothetical protein